MLVLMFLGCSNPASPPAPVADQTVTFSTLSANGTSGAVTTTVLTLNFDVAPTTLAASDITVTGATRTLGISAITVADGENVTVVLANPAGFTITPNSNLKVVPINYYTLGLTMLTVPAGSFPRDANPLNISTITTAFRMSETEITRAQFVAMLVTDPVVATNHTSSSNGLTDPVMMTNWYHAMAFCNKLSIAEGRTLVYSVSGVDFSTLAYSDIPTSGNATWDSAVAVWTNNGYRLPTEMEWEWAAMGATSDGRGGDIVVGTTMPLASPSPTEMAATVRTSGMALTGSVLLAPSSKTKGEPL